ncbi:MAG: peptidylprolyl isomerase, partial [Phycisphaerae bacterium]|nr:peptidylprolyl isomerase [Phycisphaerae bacterium]
MTRTAIAVLCASIPLLSQSAPTAPTPPAAAPPQTPAPAQKELLAQITTSRGQFTIQLRTAEAPMACANFVNLVQRGYYNGQPFNGWTRVIRQATGPSGGGSVGYSIRREFSPSL